MAQFKVMIRVDEILENLGIPSTPGTNGKYIPLNVGIQVDDPFVCLDVAAACMKKPVSEFEKDGWTVVLDKTGISDYVDGTKDTDTRKYEDFPPPA